MGGTNWLSGLWKINKEKRYAQWGGVVEGVEEGLKVENGADMIWFHHLHLWNSQ